MTRLRVLVVTGLLPLGFWGQGVAGWLTRVFTEPQAEVRHKAGGCTDPGGGSVPCPVAPPPTAAESDSAGGVDPNGKPGG